MESGIEKGRCAFNLVNKSRRCSIKGDWQRSPIDGRVQLLNCPAGNLVVNTSGHDFQTCEQCAQGKYTVDPFSGACHVCPPSATCWNGAPPIFGAIKVAGSIDMDLPEDSEEPEIRKALGSKFGVKEWQISLLARRRRTARKISFQLVASKEGISSVEARFDAYGVVREYKHDMGEPIAPGEKWEELGGMLLLRSCPPGHQLINTTNDGALDVDGQRCSKCQPNTYIVDQMHPCVKCPKGATCLDGVQFVSNAPGSEWEMERVGNGGLQWRIASCPAGYKMQREHQIPDADDCIKCIRGEYLLGPVHWRGPHETLPECFSCPKGASCSGGDNVEATEGYWRLPTNSSQHTEEAVVLQCSVGLCMGNNTCKKNLTGLKCGFCLTYGHRLTFSH